MTSTHEEPFACDGVPGFRRWSAEHGCFLWRPSRQQPPAADLPFEIPGLSTRTRERPRRLRTAEEPVAGLPWLTGYGVIWRSHFALAGDIRSRFAPGAFTASLRTTSISLLREHDWNQCLRVQGPWLEVAEDGLGLRWRCRPPANRLGHALVKEVRAGKLECSIGWHTLRSEFLAEGEGSPCRLITAATLTEISVVAAGAQRVGPNLPATWIKIEGAA